MDMLDRLEVLSRMREPLMERIAELEAENANLRRIIGREVYDSAREHAHVMTEGDRGHKYEQWVSELVRLAGEYRRSDDGAIWEGTEEALLGHAFNDGSDPT